jgi:hypothetical protein
MWVIHRFVFYGVLFPDNGAHITGIRPGCRIAKIQKFDVTLGRDIDVSGTSRFARSASAVFDRWQMQNQYRTESYYYSFDQLR